MMKHLHVFQHKYIQLTHSIKSYVGTLASVPTKNMFPKIIFRLSNFYSISIVTHYTFFIIQSSNYFLKSQVLFYDYYWNRELVYICVFTITFT